jgi:hypothetical protein
LDSPEAASKVLEVVLAAAESLSVFADRGRIVPRQTPARFAKSLSIGTG